MAHYLRENFYITTSGNFRTQALTDVLSEVGSDRVLYSVDYPSEDIVRGSQLVRPGRHQRIRPPQNRQLRDHWNR